MPRLPSRSRSHGAVLRPLRPALAVAALAALTGCSDDATFPFGWVDGDTGTFFDSGADAGVDAPSVLDTGTDTTADADTGPCAQVSCGDAQTCVEGVCVCPDGLVVSGELCLEPNADDPLTRTDAQVCARWNAEWGERATTIYTRGAATCDPGEIDPTAHEDAMRRLNLYRWMSGLGPAGVDWSNQELAQYAAVMFDANDDIQHEPPTSWACYTSEGATAAGSSNIALGYGSAAETVDGYIGDTGVPSLGHRRWCLHPDLDGVGFGHYGRGGAMWAFDSTPRASQLPFVAYPPPGPVPVRIAPGEWSLSTSGGLRNPTVRVVDLTTGSTVDVSPDYKDEGYGQDTVGWWMPSTPRAGDRYEITVTGNGGEWSWETRFVDCR